MPATALSRACSRIRIPFLCVSSAKAVNGARRSKHSRLPYLLLFYEAPHRVRDTIADLKSCLGGARRIVIARELTKLFEAIHTCRLDEAEAWLIADANREKGEFVLIVEGASADTAAQFTEAERVLAIRLRNCGQASCCSRRARAGRVRRDMPARWARTCS